MSIEVFKSVFICLMIFSFGCAEDNLKTKTPKEINVIQSPSPIIKTETTESPNTQMPKKYVSCGYCGCCGQSTPIKQCLYRSKGDDLQTIIDEDKKPRDCSKVGCAGGIEYRYCD